MKKYNRLIYIVIVLITFSSCKKEDVDVIVGTWEYNSIEFTIETNNPEATLALKESVELIKQFITSITFTFTDNGKYTMKWTTPYSSSSKEGEYELEDGKLILDKSTEAAYTLSKKKLSITGSAGSFLGNSFIKTGESSLTEFTGTELSKFDVTIKFDKK